MGGLKWVSAVNNHKATKQRLDSIRPSGVISYPFELDDPPTGLVR